jgi:hypothetical protein
MRTLVLSKVCLDRLDSGAKIAVDSDVRALRQAGHQVGLVVYRYSANEADPVTDADLVSVIDVLPGSVWLRCARAIMSRFPATSERYYSRLAEERIQNAVRRFKPDVVIIEEVALAGWMSLIRRFAPRAYVVLRSHDFIHDAVAAIQTEFSGPKALAYRIEALRARRMERGGINAADAVWAITEPDRMAYNRLCPSARVIHVPVAPDMRRFEALGEPSEPDSFVHIGTIDVKKAPGMRRFLAEVWPRLISHNPRATLYVVGRNTAGVVIHGKGVVDVGYAEDDVSWYRRVQYAVNSQTICSGITLKTLRTFAAGRTLLSGLEGVHGLSVEPGQHFWDLATLSHDSAAEEFWRSKEKSLRMANAAREWVRRFHGLDVPASVISATVPTVC